MSIEVQSTSDMATEYGIKVLVHGQSGAGKTHLCSTTDDHDSTIIISAERGLLSLHNFDIDAIEVTSIQEFREARNYVEGAEKYKWVMLDSISEIAEVILEQEKEQNRDGRAAYGEMADRVISIIRDFRNLECNVVMTCKQGREEHNGRTLHAPMLPGNKLTQNISYMFDEVFALLVDRQSDGEVKRALQTERSPHYEAKDRSGALDFYEEPNLSSIYDKIVGAAGVADAKTASGGPQQRGGGQQNGPTSISLKEQKSRIFGALNEVELDEDTIRSVAETICQREGVSQFDDLEPSAGKRWADAIVNKPADERGDQPLSRQEWAKLFVLSSRDYGGSDDHSGSDEWDTASSRYYAVCDSSGFTQPDNPDDITERLRSAIKQRHGVDSWKQIPAGAINAWCDLLESREAETADGAPRYELAMLIIDEAEDAEAA